MNGSDPNAGCPSVCKMTESNERFCDCSQILSYINGTLIDGIIPTFDGSQRGRYLGFSTLHCRCDDYLICYWIFIFSSSLMLQEVELSLLHGLF